ncbi:hypothetical protein [Pseudomonas nitroreducens]|uniref:hypothetical protein n=1 Tax=Pseudomonas nitroreducens TaxID=46680 RepID=UPI00209F1B0A|nr:hypothetical protein [Pseudomonas nitroreducens]MCP1625432.1 hypothetical protein [Pseudomonas nitroreducens]
MLTQDKRQLGAIFALSLGLGLVFAAQAETSISNEGLFEHFVVQGKPIQAGLSPQELVAALGKPAQVQDNDAECGGVLDDADKLYVYPGATFEANQQEAALDSLEFTDPGNAVVIAGLPINGKTSEVSFKQRFKDNLMLDEDGSAFFSYEGVGAREAGLLFEFKDGFVSRVENWVGC